MDLTILEDMFSNTYQLTSIPFRIYKNGTECYAIHGIKQWVDLPAYEAMFYPDGKQKVLFNITPQSTAVAIFICKDTPYSIVVGPVKTITVTKTMLQQIIFDNALTTTQAEQLKELYDKLPTMRLTYFALLVKSFYTSVNHETISTNELFTQIQHSPAIGELSDDISQVLLKRQEQITFGDKLPHNTYNYEKKLIFCIKNGLMEDLKRLGHIDQGSYIAQSSTESLRHYQNLLIAQKTLISRAAIDGGVDPELAFSISDIYSLKIEGCTSLAQLSDISSSMRMEFCNMVQKVRHPAINDMYVNRALSYITQHIAERITASEIANSLGISREYLSSKFKKTMNVSIPDYITEQKIAIAKKLLWFSDKTLLEISNYLSFSTQGYFQMQFKKQTGMTPLEYRHSKT